MCVIIQKSMPLTPWWFALIEMKLSRLQPLTTYEPVHQVTVLKAVARRTFSFRHHILETRSNRTCATVDVTGLAMDLTTRKAVAWPDDLRQTLEARLLSDRDNMTS